MKILDWIEEILCVLCTAVMTLLVFANVVSRYILHYSLSFSEEITTYLFILLSLMGTGPPGAVHRDRCSVPHGA